ncbi:hypothetical protein C8Q77DRAFT_1205677 [Trametes polyzona]|nr:hypothetical protein C8Q77DRAFT_1205677 [Trametes polyzona]
MPRDSTRAGYGLFTRSFPLVALVSGRRKAIKAVNGSGGSPHHRSSPSSRSSTTHSPLANRTPHKHPCANMQFTKPFEFLAIFAALLMVFPAVQGAPAEEAKEIFKARGTDSGCPGCSDW